MSPVTENIASHHVSCFVVCKRCCTTIVQHLCFRLTNTLILQFSLTYLSVTSYTITTRPSRNLGNNTSSSFCHCGLSDSILNPSSVVTCSSCLYWNCPFLPMSFIYESGSVFFSFSLNVAWCAGHVLQLWYKQHLTLQSIRSIPLE